MTLSRWGSNLTAKLGLAGSKPTNPPAKPSAGDLHEEEGQWFVHTGNTWIKTTPTQREIESWRVSQVVKLMDSIEGTARALEKSLVASLHRHWRVAVRGNLEALRYEVTLNCSALRTVSQQFLPPSTDSLTLTFNIDDEVIAANTQSVARYDEFMKRLSGGLRDAVGAPLPSTIGGWYEANANSPRSLKLDVEKYTSLLEGLGIQPVWPDGGPSQEEEERAAIESIIRTMNERPES